MLSPGIFREYDIRGIWGRELTPESAGLIGRGFGTYAAARLPGKRLALSVGRDVRLSSQPLAEALIAGLISTGAKVLDIGECPTPVQYFSVHHLGLDGGVMVTGSHNPPEYNGFKMTVGKETVFGNDIQAVRRVTQEARFSKGEGLAEGYPIITEYIAFLKKDFPDLSGIRVVVDAGNGTAGLVVPELLRALGVDVIELYCKPDGNFPNHHPDPVVIENLADLIRTVQSYGAHLGLAFDGDSDRLGVVDSRGEIIWGDSLIVIFSRDILRRHPGASIIGEVKCSQTMYDDVRKNGGNPIMGKTGHSLIKKKMKETGALLAGEMSGHLYFADRYFGYDDAVYASLRLLEILKIGGPPYEVRKLLRALPEVVATPEIRIDCSDAVKFPVVEQMRNLFRDYEVNMTDGIRINFGDGWALVRASNTQPALVMRFEAVSPARLAEIRARVEAEVQRALVRSMR